jgi:hypothetical protein
MAAKTTQEKVAAQLFAEITKLPEVEVRKGRTWYRAQRDGKTFGYFMLGRKAVKVHVVTGKGQYEQIQVESKADAQKAMKLLVAKANEVREIRTVAKAKPKTLAEPLTNLAEYPEV